MDILLIGAGGREHALAWSLSASPLCDRLFVAPGNPGTEQHGTNVVLDIADAQAVIAFCRTMGIAFVVIGPEGPLVAGLVDDLKQAGIKAFGPSKAAAQLEGSKAFTKDLCAEFNIPTAAYRRFTDAQAAKAYIANHGAPIVVKADGLAAGKGVVVASTIEEAQEAVDMMFGGGFGEAGAEVVVEAFLEGEEASFFALCDGTTALPFGTAQDHKRVGDGDEGPNTGGMGAYSPAAVLTPELQARVMREIIEPTLAGMRQRGTPYTGILYAGLMLTESGPQLIEYNARFGDPETQVLLPRLSSDLLTALLAAVDGALDTVSLRFTDRAALTVVMAARGYPGTVEKDTAIHGVADAEALPDVLVFHAGTRQDGDRLLANGGRVLNITAMGRTITEAQHRAYEAVGRIDWPEGFCRGDIGWRAIQRERT
ncbi:phosphoribosylamine--glycine ligase [Microvirga antarctica]|uniref:phosphoribosylamine--glycine ligase n=1 Tax=Microvirga antarctica TaxID=2819233 RepID=UPI001B3158CE|nr:phosphoribosylamine--glycine ligase [Microvirga antarctica]